MRNKIAQMLDKTVTKSLLATVLGFTVGAIALICAGYNPLEAYAMMVTGIFTSPQNIVQIVFKSLPNILTGLSVAFAFKTGLFNIGGEGQYLIGAISAVLIGSWLQIPPVLSVIIIMLCSIIAGGLYGAFSGFLKARFGISEVITTIMLNWIALYFNNYLISLPGIGIPNSQYSHAINKTGWTNVLLNWKTSPQGQQYLASHPTLSGILLGTDINYGIFAVIIAVVVIWFIIHNTTIGFRLNAVGSNKYAAELAGINVNQSITASMFIAGAVSGLAGGVQMTGILPHALTTLSTSPGYGFNGLTVALMANSSPIGCVFTALFLAVLQFGGGTIQMNLGVPSEVINIMIGVIVFFIAISTLFTMISQKIGRKRDINVAA
ncbi:MAG: ABC transporter permease [Bacillota bacterium]